MTNFIYVAFYRNDPEETYAPDDAVYTLEEYVKYHHLEVKVGAAQEDWDDGESIGFRVAITGEDIAKVPNSIDA